MCFFTYNNPDEFQKCAHPFHKKRLISLIGCDIHVLLISRHLLEYIRSCCMYIFLFSVLKLSYLLVVLSSNEVINTNRFQNFQIHQIIQFHTTFSIQVERPCLNILCDSFVRLKNVYQSIFMIYSTEFNL